MAHSCKDIRTDLSEYCRWCEKANHITEWHAKFAPLTHTCSSWRKVTNQKAKALAPIVGQSADFG